MVRNWIPGKVHMRNLNSSLGSTSGRGARAPYLTMFPEISARWSLSWAKFQIPVPRQWGREMSAPVPYVTDPFHSLSSIYNQWQFIYIWQWFSYFLHLVPLSVFRYGAHFTVAHVLLQKHSFKGSDPLLQSCFVPYGTCCCWLSQNRWHLRMRVSWTKWNCRLSRAALSKFTDVFLFCLSVFCQSKYLSLQFQVLS